jgi:hypothetical protein
MEERRNGTERRRHKRVVFKKPLILKFQFKKREKARPLLYRDDAEAKNASLGGMFIELPIIDKDQMQKLIDGKEDLQVKINLPPGFEEIDATARLVWVNGRRKTVPPIFGVGVSFENIDTKDKLAELLISKTLDEERSGKKDKA